MLRNYYINKEWILSRTAQRVYRGAAYVSIALFVLLLAVRNGVSLPEEFLPAVPLMLRIGVLGAAITLVAMEYFLFGFDNSGGLKKSFWFCVMMFPPIGPALYCLIVYMRSEVVKQFAARTRGASA